VAEMETDSTANRRRLLHCPDCHNEFFTYKLTGVSECPVCHRLCKSGPPKRRSAARTVAAILVLALLAALAYGLYKHYGDAVWQHGGATLSSDAGPTHQEPDGQEGPESQ